MSLCVQHQELSWITVKIFEVLYVKTLNENEISLVHALKAGWLEKKLDINAEIEKYGVQIRNGRQRSLEWRRRLLLRSYENIDV